MAFLKKIWKDRISEYPTRRQLTKENGDVELVTVARSEGTVSQEGDAFSAENLNDLEERIGDGFGEVNSNLAKKLTENKGTIGTSPWSSKNFNDYGSVTGSWSCGTPTDCTNCPVNETGVLSAFNGGTYVTQIYTTATHIYHRIYTATVWRPWTVYYSQTEVNDLLKYRPKSSGQNYIIAADSVVVTVTTSNSSNNSDGKRTFFNTIINTASKGFTGTPFFATATISGKQCGISYNYDNSNNAGIALSFWLPYQVVNTPVFTIGENIRISWLAIGN